MTTTPGPSPTSASPATSTSSNSRRPVLAVAATVAVLGIAAGAVLLTRDGSGDGATSTGDEPADRGSGAGAGTGDQPGAGSDPGDDTGAGGGEATLAVHLEPTEGIFVEGFDVTLRFYGAGDELLAEREWSQLVAGGDDPQAYYAYVHREPVPAGPVRLVSYMRISPGGPIPPPQEPGCETTVDVAAGGTARVTLLFEGDPNAPGGCAAVAAATAEADELLGMPRGLPAPGFVGLTVAEAEAEAAARGWTVRVVAEDGERFFVTEDYDTERVNLVVENGTVTAAARG